MLTLVTVLADIVVSITKLLKYPIFLTVFDHFTYNSFCNVHTEIFGPPHRRSWLRLWSQCSQYHQSLYLMHMRGLGGSTIKKLSPNVTIFVLFGFVILGQCMHHAIQVTDAFKKCQNETQDIDMSLMETKLLYSKPCYPKIYNSCLVLLA